MNTLYPLSVRAQAGAELVGRHGLLTEAPVDLDSDLLDGLHALARTAHAPFSENGMRLNVGAKDDGWREHSIGLQRDYIRECKRLPNVQKVVLHLAPKQWFADGDRLQQEGDYDRLVSAIQGHADLAADLGLEVVLENNRTYFPHQETHAPTTSDGLSANQYFASQPGEWRQVVHDVARDNCRACLDTSHACTAAHAFPEAEREAVMMQFVAEPELIGHVHWNGNDITDDGGRNDQHLAIHDGYLPPAVHRTVAGLDATLHLEHFFDADVLARELAFVASL